jgi:hypothetical protein
MMSDYGRITNIRSMTKEEMEAEGWDDHRGAPTVLELDDGSIMYPSMDDEGNGPGALFGRRADGVMVCIMPQEVEEKTHEPLKSPGGKDEG